MSPFFFTSPLLFANLLLEPQVDLRVPIRTKWDLDSSVLSRHTLFSEPYTTVVFYSDRNSMRSLNYVNNTGNKARFNTIENPREGLNLPPSSARYLSYSIGLNVESLLATGRFCPAEAKERCVLGNGAGLSLGAAYRTPSYSLGAVYEASFHTSNNIYQRGVLQQLRGEWRLRPRFALVTDSINGFVGAGAGLVTYGDNWLMSTFGVSGHATIGAEFDLNVKVTMVFDLTYRALYFRDFEDASGQHRPTSLVHMLGIRLGVELNDPL